MKVSFETFLFQKLEIHPKSKFLLAVSGGMDSMCLWHLFRRCELNFIVAHCNFQLRDKDSEKDEEFVKEYKTSDEQVFTKRFDTKSFAEKNKLSIQMAARELRYAWFAELKEMEQCEYIVTAHHLDDQVETFFIQLLRKSTIPGLTGIPIKTETLIRPLMFAGRESIEIYVKDHNVPYREDKSNDSEVYLRNRIRKNLMPAMQKVLPDFKNSVLDLMSNMKEVSDSFETYVNKKTYDLVRIHGLEKRIDIEKWRNIEFPSMFLEVYLRQMGFSRSTIKNIEKSTSAESGKVFYSESHRLIKDRNDLIIVPIENSGEASIKLKLTDLLSSNDFFISAEKVKNYKDLDLNRAKNIAMLDFEKLENEIEFRKWKKGDNFYPLGLGGKKKLSDFFVDNKYSLADKERQWLMLSGNEICWIVGEIIDDRYKIRESTKHVLILEQEKS